MAEIIFTFRYDTETRRFTAISSNPGVTPIDAIILLAEAVKSELKNLKETNKSDADKPQTD